MRAFPSGAGCCSAGRHGAPRRGGLGLCAGRGCPRRRHHRELRGHGLRHPGRALSPASRRPAGRILAARTGHRGGRPYLPCRGHGGAASCRSRAISCRPSSPSRSSLSSITSSPSAPSSSIISQSDKGGLVFGGHIDGFNTYTQRGQFPKVQTVAECAVAAHALRLAPAAAAPLGRHQDMTPDGSPFIGRTPIRNLYINGGWCYQGFKAVARRRAGPSPIPWPRTRSMS